MAALGSNDSARVAHGLATVRQRIERAGGDPAAVTVIAVTKRMGADAVAAAVAAGIRDVGENYAQELAAKAATAPADVRWHMIGPVQRNKVKLLAPHVQLWQTVDRSALADEIAVRAPGAAVLVQVHTTAEPTKHGCPIDAVPALVAHARDRGLDVRGLMTIGPLGSPEAARPGFRAVAALRAGLGLGELSMGMSGDVEIAVQEGATMVRIGTALFGPRSVSE
jgi:PLP dependent protein